MEELVRDSVSVADPRRRVDSALAGRFPVCDMTSTWSWRAFMPGSPVRMSAPVVFLKKADSEESVSGVL